PGVTLTAGTSYWLVASTDDIHGVSFNGAWQVSHLGASAVMTPGTLPWFAGPGQWPAARIRGTRLGSLGPLSAEQQRNAGFETDTAARRVRIFSNLNPLFVQPYLPGFGWPVVGNNVVGLLEQWRAIPFTPQANVQAKTISAALGHTSGTNQLNLGI